MDNRLRIILEDLRAEIQELDTKSIGHRQYRLAQQRFKLEVLEELERRAFSDGNHHPDTATIDDEQYVQRTRCTKCELTIERSWLDFDDRLPKWGTWSYVTWRKIPNGRVARHYGCTKKENA